MKKPNYKWFVILSLLILLVFMILYFNERAKLLETYHYPITLNITDKNWGFVVKSALDFGAIPRTGKGWKTINITNDRAFSIIVINEVNGTVAPFIFVEPYIEIPSKNKIQINVTAKTLNTSSLGHYEGELIMKVYKGKK